MTDEPAKTDIYKQCLLQAGTIAVGIMVHSTSANNPNLKYEPDDGLLGKHGNH